MGCNCGKSDKLKAQEKELKQQSIAFIKNAIATCHSCDKMTTALGIKRCSICGCWVEAKVIANTLITSRCPDSPPKW